MLDSCTNLKSKSCNREVLFYFRNKPSFSGEQKQTSDEKKTQQNKKLGFRSTIKKVVNVVRCLRYQMIHSDTRWYIPIQDDTITYKMILNVTIRYKMIQFDTRWYSIKLYNKRQSDKKCLHPIRWYAQIQHETIQNDTIRCNPKADDTLRYQMIQF